MSSGTPLINPPRFKAARDRRVNPQSVPCPNCKADVDEPCKDPVGRIVTRHVHRRRMAVRADNIARGL